jgi:hypothetical protein
VSINKRIVVLEMTPAWQIANTRGTEDGLMQVSGVVPGRGRYVGVKDFELGVARFNRGTARFSRGMARLNRGVARFNRANATGQSGQEVNGANGPTE